MAHQADEDPSKVTRITDSQDPPSMDTVNNKQTSKPNLTLNNKTTIIGTIYNTNPHNRTTLENTILKSINLLDPHRKIPGLDENSDSDDESTSSSGYNSSSHDDSTISSYKDGNQTPVNTDIPVVQFKYNFDITPIFQPRTGNTSNT